MADVKGDGARGPKRGLFGKLRDTVDSAKRAVIAKLFGKTAEQSENSAKEPKGTRSTDSRPGLGGKLRGLFDRKPEMPSGPVPEVLKRALRQDLRRRIPDSWFTKKRTRGVVTSYANTLREMGPNSRRWCRAWFGDERPYFARQVAAEKRRERKARRRLAQ